jgi:hypothetical protein
MSSEYRFRIVNSLAEAWQSRRQIGDILLISSDGDGFVGVSLGHGDHFFERVLSREQAVEEAMEQIHKWNQYVDDQQGPDIVLGLLP